MRNLFFSGFFIGLLVLLTQLYGCAKAEQIQTPTVYLKIEFHVQAERRDDLMAIMATLNQDMRGEEGFIKAYVYLDQDDANHITLIETWQTRALHEQHFQAIVANGSWAQILDMLSRVPSRVYMNPFNGEQEDL
ncbi:MAG: antibiotic biosynthesis monooxygenase [Robiginitomaculum sp.]|nr:antibiotic biosynthesis monooxygenase [Robiginitomaculum sp.]